MGYIGLSRFSADGSEGRAPKPQVEKTSPKAPSQKEPRLLGLNSIQRFYDGQNGPDRFERRSTGLNPAALGGQKAISTYPGVQPQFRPTFEQNPFAQSTTQP